MRFLRHGGIYRSDAGLVDLTPGRLRRLPLVGARARVLERDGRSASYSLASSAMSSGRLFLDRVARQHCPSPLHRQLHPKTVPGWGTMKWQRAANSVLTVCLTKRGKRKVWNDNDALCCRPGIVEVAFKLDCGYVIVTEAHYNPHL